MIGIIMGYLLGALAADAKQFGIDQYLNWRRAIFIQGIALYVIAGFIMCYPNDKIDIMAVGEERGGEQSAASPVNRGAEQRNQASLGGETYTPRSGGGSRR